MAITNWAAKHIESLHRGETVKFRSHGNSMTGKIESGQLCEVTPDISIINEGDIVLVRVRGKIYLHLVKKISNADTYLIGNNKGHSNGWVEKCAIFGKLLSVID